MDPSLGAAAVPNDAPAPTKKKSKKKKAVEVPTSEDAAVKKSKKKKKKSEKSEKSEKGAVTELSDGKDAAGAAAGAAAKLPEETVVPVDGSSAAEGVQPEDDDEVLPETFAELVCEPHRNPTPTPTLVVTTSDSPPRASISSVVASSSTSALRRLWRASQPRRGADRE